MEEFIKALTSPLDEILRKLKNNEKLTDAELIYFIRVKMLIDRIKGDNKNVNS